MHMGGGYLRYRTKFLSQLPFASAKNPMPIVDLTQKALSARKDDTNADVMKIETKVDQLVYKLYDLTSDEIAIVESRYI